MQESVNRLEKALIALTNLENMAGYKNAGTSITAFAQCMSDTAMELIEQAGVTLIFTGALIVVKDPLGKIISALGATYSIFKIIQAYNKGLL